MKKTTLFLILPILLAACNTGENKKLIKPNSSGKSGEILVVVQDNIWDRSIGDTIFYSLSEPFGVLPQDEPFFNVVNIPHDAFQNIFKTHRNIIFINISQQHKEPKLTTARDKWANNQLIYNYYAPNDTAFITLWEKTINDVKNAYFNEELSRFQQAYKKYINPQTKDFLATKYNLTVNIPNEYNVDVKKDHFCWISRETDISSQGIFIYDYPYVDTNTFTTDYLIKKRDEITKENVPGPNEGTYMQTEKGMPVKVEKFYLNGNYAYLIRGLWYTENYFLGGPFVSISVLDEARNRIVTIEAYVYAGKKDKKLYLWQTESIIKTLKFVN